jgi:16S rRNA (cytosine1402-N4)-methyltransferase
MRPAEIVNKSDSNFHVPVLLSEVLFFLQKIGPGSNRVFDGTFGGGSYTRAFLQAGHQVWACDLDLEAYQNGLQSFKTELDQFNLHLVRQNFADYIQDFDADFFNYIVLDLGFSSNQLSYSGRGFSYKNLSESFDLRYNTDQGVSAATILKSKPVDKLGTIIYTYSGEKFARPISRSLGLLKSLDLEQITVEKVVHAVANGVPVQERRRLNEILSRVWQSFRIEVNQEFASLKQFLGVAGDKLKPGGMLAVVTFHSLEDKLVTSYFRDLARPVEVDSFGNKKQDFELLTKKAVRPSEAEVLANPRSRSAGLRVLKKL